MKYYFEKRFNLLNYKILGIDEAGRGNLAGEMVVCGCILNINKLDKKIIDQIDDSKKLTKNNREKLYEYLIKNCIYHYEVIPVSIINKLGPKKASLYGMNKIIEELEDNVDLILVDYEKPKSNKKCLSLIHGDQISLNIASASIIAKHIKDELIKEFCLCHPLYKEYDFINNSGYGTKKHLEAIKEFGIIKNYHRLNYKPVKNSTKINKTYNNK
ncbi:ribonuclease HII [bacterium]|nr:ribonuclease HII [bacterium]